MTTQPENKPEHIETLAERSARLEAEAKALGEGKPLEFVAPAGPEAPTVNTSALEEELAQTKDQMIRALAEVENIRKRSQKEREDATKYAATAFSKDMLDVADNLRRALDAIPLDLIEAEPRLKNLVDGIQATEAELEAEWVAQVATVASLAGLSIPHVENKTVHYGGRQGIHTVHLNQLLKEMDEVFAIDTQAVW